MKEIEPYKEIYSTEAQANQPPARDDDTNWLVSYADLMTLLCGFFIILFSMAKLDERQYNAFQEAVAKQFGGTYVPPSEEMLQNVKQMIRDIGLQDHTVVRAENHSIVIIFESAIFFDTLSAEITYQGRLILTNVIKKIRNEEQRSQREHKIIVEGHTDSRPILGGLFPSNWELSGARASRVIRLFIEEGFKPTHLTAVGYADTYPQNPIQFIDGKWDESSLNKNRRVVLRILDPSSDAIPFPEAHPSSNPM